MLQFLYNSTIGRYINTETNKIPHESSSQNVNGNQDTQIILQDTQIILGAELTNQHKNESPTQTITMRILYGICNKGKAVYTGIWQSQKSDTQSEESEQFLLSIKLIEDIQKTSIVHRTTQIQDQKIELSHLKRWHILQCINKCLCQNKLIYAVLKDTNKDTTNLIDHLKDLFDPMSENDQYLEKLQQKFQDIENLIIENLRILVDYKMNNLYQSDALKLVQLHHNILEIISNNDASIKMLEYTSSYTTIDYLQCIQDDIFQNVLTKLVYGATPVIPVSKDDDILLYKNENSLKNYDMIIVANDIKILLYESIMYFIRKEQNTKGGSIRSEYFRNLYYQVRNVCGVNKIHNHIHNHNSIKNLMGTIFENTKQLVIIDKGEYCDQNAQLMARMNELTLWVSYLLNHTQDMQQELKIEKLKPQITNSQKNLQLTMGYIISKCNTIRDDEIYEQLKIFLSQFSELLKYINDYKNINNNLQ